MDGKMRLRFKSPFCLLGMVALSQALQQVLSLGCGAETGLSE